VVERYRFIQAECAMVPVQILCSVMRVSRSGFYDWKKRLKKNQDRLIVDIKSIHRASRGTYGVPRISIKLKEMGHTAGRHTIHKVMRQENLFGLPIHRKKYRSPKIAREDLVRQNFTAEHPNQIWCCDITQKWTGEGWFYLAVVLDLYSRRIVGWSTGSNMRTELPLRALNQALVLRGNPKGVIHHSDRGSQCTSEQYLKRQKNYELLLVQLEPVRSLIPFGLSPSFAQSR
jgi:putative transposase